MLEYKQGVAARVPVRMLAADWTAVTGLAYGSVTVSFEKADGTVVNFTPASGADWAEVTAGAFANVGKYDLLVPLTATDQPGPFTYVVKAAGADAYVGVVKVVANEEADTFARLGAPVGASVAADIVTANSALTSALTYLVRLIRAGEGRWKIATSGPNANTLILYSADGTTVLQKWNLFDDTGTATTTSIFERVPTQSIP